MDYKKFFNSNPSAAGNSAVTNVKALQEMQLWLGGQEIIDIKVGEAGDGYTPLTFTKENGDTYTVNIPTVQGKQGEGGQGFNFVGAWTNGNNEYHPYDVVTYNGGSYICIETINSKITPDTDKEHWSVFVPKGVCDVTNKVIILNNYVNVYVEEGEYVPIVVPISDDYPTIYKGDTIIFMGERKSYDSVDPYFWFLGLSVVDSVERDELGGTQHCITIIKNTTRINSYPRFERGNFTRYDVSDCIFNDDIITIGSLAIHNIEIKKDSAPSSPISNRICITIVDDKTSSYTSNEFFSKYNNKTITACGYFNLNAGKSDSEPCIFITGVTPVAENELYLLGILAKQ